MTSSPRGRRRRLGQCFLVDPEVAERIVALLHPAPARVVEIGPGRGALAAPLLDRFARVLAIEVDGGLIPSLAPLVGRGLEVVAADALTAPLAELLAAEAPWQLASNLPYSVGTAILRRVLPLAPVVERVVVMVQREVAARIVAEPGEREHGLLALERAAHGRARVAFDVAPGSFRPQPEVWSSVVVLDLVPCPLPSARLAPALALAGHALTRARKTLTNACRPLADVMAIEAAGLDPGARPGTVSLAGWVALADHVDDGRQAGP